MAARKRNWQTNKTREKIRDSIKTSLIVKRFEDHVLKSEEDEGYVKLSATQIKAGEVLLGRTLPTLSSSEIVEVEKEQGIDQSIDKLKQLLGPELANLLLTNKGDLTTVLTALKQEQENPIVHETPEATQ
jgi:hypothetical protein